MVDEKLHILFMRNDRLYCVGAEDDGYRWGFLPLEEREGEAGKLSKAIFLSNNRSERGFLANELLVNEGKPWDIQVISGHVLPAYTQKVQAQAVQLSENTEMDYNDFFENMENELSEFMGMSGYSNKNQI